MMQKISRKITLVFIVSAILFLVGGFLFAHNSQNLNPAFSVAHAESLHDDLVNSPTNTQPWIFDIWKIMLALANVVVIVMLLFVAIVNIVHLQYDTYAIKKSLPLLIIGIIMANFSLLICRMIVDAAQVLTNTFASDPKSLIEGYLCTLALGSGGEAKWFTVFTGSFSFIIIIFFGLAILIAVLILAFLLWMRKTVIFLLVAVAPLAFILYAFPPTQGLFKKWWSWFLTWTFMGPLVMLIVWAASKIGATNCGATTGFNVSAMFAVIGLTYLAAIVPFKLGGPVMGAWANLGKKLASPGTNLAKGAYDIKKQDAQAFALKKIPLVGRAAGYMQNNKDRSDLGLKTELAAQKRLHNERKGGEYTLARKAASIEEDLAKTQEAKYLNDINEGTMDSVSKRTLQHYTGVSDKLELKAKYSSIDDQLQKAEAALKKRLTIDLANKGNEAMTLHQNLMSQIKGKTVTSYDGNDLDYDATQTALSSLRNEYNTTADGDPRKAEIGKDIARLEKESSDFVTAQTQSNPKLNFGHYLNKNTYGRMQARVNPMLGEEVEAILKSENVDQITDALENGGGTSEFRFSGEDAKNYISGQVDKVSIPARYGVQSYLMAMQAKVSSPSGIDYLEAVSGGVQLFDKVSPGAKQQMMRSIREQVRPETLTKFENKIGKSFESLTANEIVGLSIYGPQNSEANELVRRLAIQIRQHPALGAAGSPGAYTGKATKASVLAEDLMGGKPPTTTAQPGTPEYEQQYQEGVVQRAEGVAAKALGGAVALKGATPEERVLQNAESAMNQINDSGAETIITSMQTDIINRIKPQEVVINDSALRKRITDTIANFQGANINDLTAQLKRIDSRLNATFNPQTLSEVQWSAKKVKTGLDNIKALSKVAAIETCLPHYSTDVKKLDVNATVALQSDIGSLADKIQTQINQGATLSSNPEITVQLDNVLKVLGHTRIDREKMLQNINTHPAETFELVRKKGFALEAAKRLKTEYQEAVQQATTDGKPAPANFEDNSRQVNQMIKRVIMEKFGDQEPTVTTAPQTTPTPPTNQTPPTPPPAPTPPSTPPPGAPIG